MKPRQSLLQRDSRRARAARWRCHHRRASTASGWSSPPRPRRVCTTRYPGTRSPTLTVCSARLRRSGRRGKWPVRRVFRSPTSAGCAPATTTWRSSGRRFAASRRHGACPITRPVRRLPRKCWVSLGVRPTDSDVVLAVRRVVSQWYHAGMGMTLRTSEKQTEALRRQALAEGRSMQAVALSAIDEYIERRAHQTEVNAVLDKVIERERGVLRRLADT